MQCPRCKSDYFENTNLGFLECGQCGFRVKDLGLLQCDDCKQKANTTYWVQKYSGKYSMVCEDCSVKIWGTITMTVIYVDGDFEKALRKLKKAMYPELAALRWREHYPKRSEYKRWKRKKAERKRLSRERRMERLQVKHDRWLRKQIHEESRQRRARLHAN
jgi:ribosomal protein S21